MRKCRPMVGARPDGGEPRIEAIKEDPDTGLFSFRLEMGRSRDDKRVQANRAGFPDYESAAEVYKRLRAQRDAGRIQARLTGTVRALCDSWLRARVQQLEPNTFYNYSYALGLACRHVGDTRVTRLSRQMVERMYRDLEREGYSRTTVRTMGRVFAKALLEEGGIKLGARKPRLTDRLRPVWTLEEANTFLAYVREDRLYALWRLLVVTGLRRGELAGLKWDDFDPMTGTIRVVRQRVVEGDDSAVREKRPKSPNSIRSVMLDRETAAMLGRLRRVGGSAYMFTGRTNMPLRPDNITDRFNKLSAAAGVRQIGPHQIRHMLVSSLLDSGYGVHEVAERLGHDPATLMRYYTRVNAVRRRQAADHAAALVTGQLPFTGAVGPSVPTIPQQARRARGRSGSPVG